MCRSMTHRHLQAKELEELRYNESDTVKQRHATISSTWDEIMGYAAARESNLREATEVQQKLDELWLTIARESGPSILEYQPSITGNRSCCRW